MPPAIDLTGRKYGRLLVLSLCKERQSRSRAYLCRCECGSYKIILRSNIKNGHTKSCGCLSRETTSKLNKTHGKSKSKLYGIWKAMLDRCENPLNKNYHNYGGRGIKVCDRWKNIDNFISDVGQQPGKLSLDRIDNEGNYEPSNCRWADRSVQNINKRVSNANKLGIKGIHFEARTKKYFVQIVLKRKITFIGRFSRLEDAIAARLKSEEIRDSFLSTQKNLVQLGKSNTDNLSKQSFDG